MNGEQEFDGIVALARGLHQAVLAGRAAKTAAREATRDRRNARRRARYVPKAQRPAAPPVDVDEQDWEPTCRCYIAAPCTFCETGGEA